MFWWGHLCFDVGMCVSVGTYILLWSVGTCVDVGMCVSVGTCVDVGMCVSVGYVCYCHPCC